MESFCHHKCPNLRTGILFVKKVAHNYKCPSILAQMTLWCLLNKKMQWPANSPFVRLLEQWKMDNFHIRPWVKTEWNCFAYRSMTWYESMNVCAFVYYLVWYLQRLRHHCANFQNQNTRLAGNFGPQISFGQFRAIGPMELLRYFKPQPIACISFICCVNHSKSKLCMKYKMYINTSACLLKCKAHNKRVT